MTGRRILGVWLLLILVTFIGWVAGTVYADSYIDGLDRDEICANTGVALGDTLLRGVEQARRDSTELAQRNCSSRYQLARQGREMMVYTPLAIVVLLGALVTGLFSLFWVLKRARAGS